jgi:hypothetical protein
VELAVNRFSLRIAMKIFNGANGQPGTTFTGAWNDLRSNIPRLVVNEAGNANLVKLFGINELD